MLLKEGLEGAFLNAFFKKVLVGVPLFVSIPLFILLKKRAKKKEDQEEIYKQMDEIIKDV